MLENPQQLHLLSKSLSTFLPLTQVSLENHFGREDLLIAFSAHLIDAGCAPFAQLSYCLELLAESHLIDEAGELLYPDNGQIGEGKRRSM